MLIGLQSVGSATIDDVVGIAPCKDAAAGERRGAAHMTNTVLGCGSTFSQKVCRNELCYKYMDDMYSADTSLAA